jgi:cathepsin X
VLLSCSQGSDEFGNLGCHGGYAIDANKWIYENYITDETCAIYQSRGWTNGLGCSAMSFCRDCKAGQACFIPEKYYIYGIAEYGPVKGEVAMMNEIMNRGPISCAVADPQSLIDYTYGIYYDETGRTSEDHEISVVGWGEENGVKFWRVRNSWGSHWGEEGFFRVVRGVNNIGIEQDCDWAVPLDTWTDKVMHITTEEE